MMDLLHRRCAAVYCRKSGKDGKTRLFRFPVPSNAVQRQRYQIWAAVAENPHPNKRAFLCARHFHKNQFKDPFRYNLLRGAIPSRDAWYPYTSEAVDSFQFTELPVIMDTIKTEPEDDPLAVDAVLEERNPSPDEESTDPSYDIKWEVKIEETAVPIIFPVLKCESMAETLGVAAVKQEYQEESEVWTER
ncbi:uncharacterized protein [Periplaneta americana]|uniref:uncharacterized protein isoform X2 n=1 Tax=Periplaneta americana TaxID=6978 RepID=UPI0037E7A3DC